MKWIARISFGLAMLIVALLLVLIIFLGPILKWGIEKYDVAYTGRQIDVSKVKANAFTGELNLYDLMVWEASGSDTFFYVRHVYANLELMRFLREHYDVVALTLERPFLVVQQEGLTFNFDDLSERFLAADTTAVTDEPGEPVQFRVENIALRDGRINYTEKGYQASVRVDRLNLTCPLIDWRDPHQHYAVDGRFVSGGSVSGLFDMDVNSLQYRVAAKLDSVEIAPFTRYALDAVDIRTLEGKVDLDFLLAGNFNTPKAIALHGQQTLRDFRLIDANSDTLTTVDAFSFKIDSLNTDGGIYDFGVVQMERPYIRFERYPNGDNFTRLLKDTTLITEGIDTTLADADYGNPFLLLTHYTTALINDYVMQDYSVDSVVVKNGTVVYLDHALQEPFFFRMDSLYLSSGALNSKDSRLNFGVNAKVNQRGTLKAELAFDPHDLENMEMVYHMEDVRLSSFSPYSTYYVAHPLQDGLVYYDNTTRILNQMITSDNKMVIRKIQVGKKVKNATAFDLPLRLAVAILRDKEGHITLEVPVEGNLNDPEYRLGKVIWNVIKNLLLKAATAPYNLLARAIDANEDDLKAVKFEYLSDSLSRRQQRNLSLLARVLKQKPELKIELTYLAGYPDEAGMLAAFEAKKRYILNIDSTSTREPTAAQLEQIHALSVNDSSFVDFLNRRLLFEGDVPAIEKCKRLVGRRRLAARMEAMVENRKKVITDYLVVDEALPPESFEIVETTERVSDGIPTFEVTFDVADE